MEDLKVKGLSRGRLARSVHDAGWNGCFAKLCYKAECAGRELARADPPNQPVLPLRLLGAKAPGGSLA